MSRTGGSAREPSDAYMTDDQVALACTCLLPLGGWRVLEGSAGEGAWLRAAWAAWGVIPDTVELRRECAPFLEAPVQVPRLPSAPQRGRPRCDVTDFGLECRPSGPVPVVTYGRLENYHQRGYDAVIGNPPYSHAEQHVRHGLYLVRTGGIVAYLLRLNFLAADERYAFRNTFPVWRVYTLQERPSFTGTGSDACEYALFVWRKGYAGSTVMRHVSWKYPERFRQDLRIVVEQDWRELRPGLRG